MKKSLHVIKIGGNVIDDPGKLNAFLKDFAQIKDDKILVHGGGKLATVKAEEMKIPQHLIDGRRITDADTLELITMVYGGLISKNIVATLAALGNNALGLSGADGNSVLAEKRPTKPIDFGYVGDVKTVNANNIKKLLESGFVPVYCAITHDGKGQLLNTNADTMASVIASAMQEDYNCFLYYGFEKNGVLENADDEKSVISKITPQSYQNLKKEGKIFAGMIPKLDTAFQAVYSGVKSVYIINSENLSSLIISKEKHGTRITS